MTKTPARVLLVIEDEMNIVAVIKQSLLGAAFDIHVAPNGETGIEMTRELQPDVVLLDIALPGIDGFETLAAIRSTPFGTHVPVIIITAHGDSSTAVEAREAGADHFLTKPFLPSQLRRAVESLSPLPFSESA